MRILDSFYNNLIAEDRYRMILDGLQVTLLITLDFMVKNLQESPLSSNQRSQLSGLCRQVVEEPTALGFRVSLVI